MFRFPPRRILVAIDFSEPSLFAFRAARQAAERFGARLEAVHCEPPPEIEPTDEERRRSAASVRRFFSGADAVHCARGNPTVVIPRLARDRRADLVVVGTHARKGSARLNAESVAEAILRRCAVPVLIARREFRAPARVLAPVRGDAGSRAALIAAGIVARAYRARLDVLHVTGRKGLEDPARVDLLAALDALPSAVARDAKPVVEVRRGSPLKEILRATRGRDLLVVAARPKSLIEDVLLGTTAERLARHSPIPLLAIPVPGGRGATLFSA